MSRQMMSVQDAAQMLIESADGISADEFEKLAGIVLEDNTPGEIEAIAAYCPESTEAFTQANPALMPSASARWRIAGKEA